MDGTAKDAVKEMEQNEQIVSALPKGIRRTLDRKNFNNDCLAYALTELMERKALDKISIRELTERAGVSRASYYRHFESKEDLLQYRLSRLTLDWWHDLYDRENEFTDYAAQMMEFIEGNSKLFAVLYRQNLLRLFFEYLTESAGPKKEDPPKDAYRKIIRMYGFYGLLSEWLRRGQKETPEELAQVISETIVNIADRDYHSIWDELERRGE